MHRPDHPVQVAVVERAAPLGIDAVHHHQAVFRIDTQHVDADARVGERRKRFVGPGHQHAPELSVSQAVVGIDDGYRTRPLVDPSGLDQPSALPLPAIEIELAEQRQVLGAQAEVVGTEA